MILLEFQPTCIYITSPPLWKVFYKDQDESEWHSIYLTYNHLKELLKEYGYETNNSDALSRFGISIQNIKQNDQL